MEVGNNIKSSPLNTNKYSSNTSKDKLNNGDFEKALLDSENKQNVSSPQKASFSTESELDSVYNFISPKSNVYDGQTTNRGTKIVKPGSDMDKNAFLKILATQMSNQDPTQSQDGTEYISQFAQFASMEQMSNLNDTMSQFASQSLIGKGVMVDAYDSNGRPITGVVKAVNQNGSNITVGIEYLNEAGEVTFGEFKKDDITNVVDTDSNSLDYINNNMSMLVASSMINKDVEFIYNTSNEGSTPIYETLNGIVQSVVVDNYMVKLNIRIKDTDEIKTVTLDKISKVEGEEYVNNY